MKALKMVGYGSIEDNLQFEEVDIPPISTDEILVRIIAASLNPHDYKLVLGELRKVEKLKLPAFTGSDFCGVIIEAGSAVKNFKVGDQVFGTVTGALAEFCAVEASTASKKPKNLTYEEASSIPVAAMTTIQSFNRIGGIKKGDNVLIHAGSGGVGTFAIQYAKQKGAYIYTTTSTSNIELVKRLGADVAIDYKKENYLEVCSGLDIVFDTLGGQHTFDAFKIIKRGGRVVSLLPAEINGVVAREFSLPSIISLFLSLKPSKIKNRMREKNAMYKFVFMRPNGKDLEEASALLEGNLIKPVIEKRYEFENAKDAFMHLSKGHAKGKLTISFN